MCSLQLAWAAMVWVVSSPGCPEQSHTLVSALSLQSPSLLHLTSDTLTLGLKWPSLKTPHPPCCTVVPFLTPVFQGPWQWREAKAMWLSGYRASAKFQTPEFKLEPFCRAHAELTEWPSGPFLLWIMESIPCLAAFHCKEFQHRQEEPCPTSNRITCPASCLRFIHHCWGKCFIQGTLCASADKLCPNACTSQGNYDTLNVCSFFVSPWSQHE